MPTLPIPPFITALPADDLARRYQILAQHVREIGDEYADALVDLWEQRHGPNRALLLSNARALRDRYRKAVAARDQAWRDRRAAAVVREAA